MPIKRLSCTSLSQYIDAAASFVEDWSETESGEITPWYRGQKAAEWPLVPGHYRYSHLMADEIRSEFILKATDLLPRVPASDWEWYFLMQHYGLPTRLLDWTTGSLIALHFALCHDTASQDAAVWVINPWQLNEWSLSSPDLLLSTDAAARLYLGAPYADAQIPARPAAIVPPYNSPRITVQRGAFSVHGSSPEPLDLQYHGQLAKITIPAAAAVRLRRELRTAGISEFTLFPDLDGLSRDIGAQFVDGC